MTAHDDDADDDIAQRADGLYAARAALADATPRPRRLGIAEIVQFLTDSRRSLSADEQRSLFANPQVRADYRRLKAQLSVFELPALAAASDGQVGARRFDGGSISIHPSRVAGQTYVILRFDSLARPPAALVLERPSGELVKRALPDGQSDSEAMMIVLDSHNADDETFLRVLRDPTATGSFLL
jgi:hypothetical protein